MEERQYRPKLMISAESIVISNYIRYNVLERMTAEAFSGSNANVVNIYIDLYQLFRKMYRSDILIGDRSSVASGVVNMCAHYREFYRKYYGVHTRIYLMQTSGPMKNSSTFVPDYNIVNMEKMALAEMMTTFMLQNCAILKELCKYLPDIYYIEAPIETSAMIYANIQDRLIIGDSDPNIIISTSHLQYMVAALSKTPTVVFNHKWYNNDIIYKIISNKYTILKYMYIYGAKVSEKTLDKCVPLNSGLLGLLIAMTRYEHRSMKSVFNISTALTKLNDAINNGCIVNSYISPDSIDIMSEYLEDKVDIIKNRYKAIDVLYQSNLYMMGNYYLDKSWDVNLQDPDMIKLLSDKYFRYNPLDLDRI